MGTRMTLHQIDVTVVGHNSLPKQHNKSYQHTHKKRHKELRGSAKMPMSTGKRKFNKTMKKDSETHIHSH